jgi:hypothetical protein
MSSKSAEAMHTTENHAEKKPSELHPDPEGHRSVENKDVTEGNQAAWNEFVVDNPKLLRKAFDGFEASSKGDKAFMAQHFTGREYESRSPLLRKYAQEGSIPTDSTLSERVRALTGRR